MRVLFSTFAPAARLFQRRHNVDKNFYARRISWRINLFGLVISVVLGHSTNVTSHAGEDYILLENIINGDERQYNKV